MHLIGEYTCEIMTLDFMLSHAHNSIIFVFLVFQAANQILRTAELLVTNLPFEPSDEAMAKARLRAFSDSCGGRVSQICRDKYSRRAHCVISFASADDADRYVDIILKCFF